jgi:hypothetical protein
MKAALTASYLALCADPLATGAARVDRTAGGRPVAERATPVCRQDAGACRPVRPHDRLLVPRQ